MSKINYPSSSPYAITPQASWYIGNYVHRTIPAATDDSIITISKKYENRPDILSYDLYGTPAYWWVFIVRNRNILKDPIFDMKSGIKITVPSAANIAKSIGS